MEKFNLNAVVIVLPKLLFVSFANFVLLTNVFCSHLSSHEHVHLPAPYAPCRGSDRDSGHQRHQLLLVLLQGW